MTQKSATCGRIEINGKSPVTALLNSEQISAQNAEATRRERVTIGPPKGDDSAEGVFSGLERRYLPMPSTFNCGFNSDLAVTKGTESGVAGVNVCVELGCRRSVAQPHRGVHYRYLPILDSVGGVPLPNGRNSLADSELKVGCYPHKEGYCGSGLTGRKREAMPNFFSVYPKIGENREQASSVYAG